MTKVRFWPWRRKICNTGYLQSVYTAVYSAVSVQTGMWPRLCTCQRTLSLAEDLKLAACLFQKKVFFELGTGQAAEIVAACSWAGTLALVIKTWTRDPKASPAMSRWRLKDPDTLALCPAKLCCNRSCFRFARKDGDRVSLLR